MSAAGIAGAATFICGHPKSGTTLLLSLLDAHPELVVFPRETGFFRAFSTRCAGVSLTESMSLAEGHLLSPLCSGAPPEGGLDSGESSAKDEAMHFEDLQRSFRAWMSRLPAEFTSILPAAILAYGETAGRLGSSARRWVEKTPLNELFAAHIFRAWPQARCIHIVRDPRDNYASYIRKHTDWTPLRFAGSWHTSAHRALQNAQRFGPRRYLVVRYEDLVTHLEPSAARIAAFLGIEDHPSLRQPTVQGRPWRGNSMFAERFEGVSGRPVKRYLEHLPPHEVRQLESMLASEMQRLGYARDQVFMPSAWLRWQAYRLQWHMRRLSGRPLKAAG